MLCPGSVQHNNIEPRPPSQHWLARFNRPGIVFYLIVYFYFIFRTYFVPVTQYTTLSLWNIQFSQIVFTELRDIQRQYRLFYLNFRTTITRCYNLIREIKYLWFFKIFIFMIIITYTVLDTMFLLKTSDKVLTMVSAA